MKIIVMGAGVIGVTTAYYLARDGHEVHVIDRQTEAAMETSFGNGGVLHTSEAEPWSQPGMPRKVLGWIGKENAPMLLRMRALPSMWSWGLKFMRNCTPERYRFAAGVNLGIANLTLTEIKAIREQTDIAYDLAQKGVLKIYRSAADMDTQVRETRMLSDHGMVFEVAGPDRCVQIEPALASLKPQLAGGIYAPNDEHGDCHKFTKGLRAYCEERLGVTFHMGTEIIGLDRTGDRIDGVRTSRGHMTANVYVIALASYTPKMLAGTGVRVDIYPAKGIAVTVSAANWPDGPQVPIIEIAKLFGLIRIGDRYRCSGSVEFNGWDRNVNPARAKAIVDNVSSVFPEFQRCYAPETAHVWAGLRPMSASGNPYIGRSKLRNLFLNCGHGHLGWTMSAGSSRLLADSVAGRTPAIDMRGVDPATHI